MTLLRTKLRRDLRASASRIAAMVVAIAVSLTVFGAVLAAWAVLDRESEDAYLGTEPASATILLGEPVDAARMTELADAARDLPGVVEATGRTQFTGDVEGRENPLQVFVAGPGDPMRMAKFEVDGGSWPPAPGEILLAADTPSLMDVAVGDTITVTLPGGATVPLRIAGTVYDPSLSPSAQEQTGRAYLSAASLPESAVYDQLKLQIADPGGTAPSRDRDAVVAGATAVAEWLRDERGVPVREVQVPEPYAHPHQWQADALILSVLVGAAIALLLSTILVAAMLNTLFTRQIPQIGILKAIGARSARIGRHYLTMTLLVAAAATLVALPVAVLIGRSSARWILGLLGVRDADLAAPWWVYALIAAAGLGLPPLMALAPIVKAARTTVRAAIDHHGLGAGTSKATGLLAWLGRLRRLDRGLLMALRNTLRRPARFALSAGLLAAAGTVFVAGMSLGSGVAAVDEERAAQWTWDVDVNLTERVPAAEVRALLAGVPGVVRAEAWGRVPTGVAAPGGVPVTRTYPDQGHGGVAITVIPPDSTMLTEPKLRDGRALETGETGAIVINQITRDDSLPGAAPGDTVQLVIDGAATTWTIVGIVEERGGSGVYATAEGLTAATGRPAEADQLRIATAAHDEASRDAVAAEVERVLTGAGIGVRTSVSVSRMEAISSGHLGPVISILLVIAIAMGIVGGIGLASTMSANVLDRTREFGVMHAIGARPRTVRRIVAAEGVFLALASCLSAVVPALLLTKVLGAGFGELFLSAPLPYRISPIAAGIWVLLVVLGAALATDAAAGRASRITVREAIAHL